MTALPLPHDRPEDEAQAERRARILDAAERCFVRSGFHRTTMQDVAAEAKMSPGNLYRYFPSKGELFAEALALNAQHEVRVVAAVAEVEEPASSRLANAVRVFAERAVRARRLAWAMLAEPAEPEVAVARLIYRRTFEIGRAHV